MWRQIKIFDAVPSPAAPACLPYHMASQLLKTNKMICYDENANILYVHARSKKLIDACVYFEKGVQQVRSRLRRSQSRITLRLHQDVTAPCGSTIPVARSATWRSYIIQPYVVTHLLENVDIKQWYSDIFFHGTGTGTLQYNLSKQEYQQ
jgi:hypothetical protein